MELCCLESLKKGLEVLGLCFVLVFLELVLLVCWFISKEFEV